jgi:ferredoxin
MSVAITFEDQDLSGLVAEGTYLWAAAKRLGVRLPAECNGRGECDACALVIVQGADLLSPSTAAERNILGPERLARAERLACQTQVNSAGEVLVRPVAVGADVEDKHRYRKRFRDLPLNQQVSALIEIEATVISEALNTVRGKYATFVGMLLNLAPPPQDANRAAGDETNARAGTSEKKD